MNQFIETGGVKIGAFKATWPFGTLRVSQFKLELNASIRGTFIFKRSDIISIKPENSLLGGSIRITHRVAKYNEDILFTFMGNADERMSQIAKTGFLNYDEPSPSYIDDEITELQNLSGFPFKVPVVIGIVVIWNLLFLTDMLNIFHLKKEGEFFGIGVGLALAFVFSLCLLLLTSGFVRQLVLKNNCSISGLKGFLLFIAFLTFVLFAAGFLPQYLTFH